MKISKNGIDLIKSFEGLRLAPYLDSKGIPTIGWGTILYPNNVAVTMKDVKITEDQAEEYLNFEVNKKVKNINSLVKVSINQNQFDALACFTYNLGVSALTKSTLLRFLNERDISSAAEEFLKWNKIKDKNGQFIVLSGLTRRRQAERSLFLQSVPSSSGNLLPDGPTEEEINKKLADIEKDLK